MSEKNYQLPVANCRKPTANSQPPTAIFRPAIFFDRDNTLIAAHDYLGDPQQVRLITGAADAIARLRRLGFAIVTASNQSGVARGHFDESAVAAVNARMDRLLQQANPNAIIDHHEYCPFHPEAVIEQYRQDSDLRKPKPGMLLRAAAALNLDLTQSWLIGDSPRDIAAGRAAGCRTILFHDPALPPSPASAETPVIPDHQSPTLLDAARYIQMQISPHRS
jgi:D-glycero-D-manno-heptose 1,7-bisphosphate phosphatase